MSGTWLLRQSGYYPPCATRHLFVTAFNYALWDGLLWLFTSRGHNTDVAAAGVHLKQQNCDINHWYLAYYSYNAPKLMDVYPRNTKFYFYYHYLKKIKFWHTVCQL